MRRGRGLLWGMCALVGAFWGCETSRNPGGVQRDVVSPTIQLAGADTQDIKGGLNLSVVATDNLGLKDIRLTYTGGYLNQTDTVFTSAVTNVTIQEKITPGTGAGGVIRVVGRATDGAGNFAEDTLFIFLQNVDALRVYLLQPTPGAVGSPGKYIPIHVAGAQKSGIRRIGWYVGGAAGQRGFGDPQRDVDPRGQEVPARAHDADADPATGRRAGVRLRRGERTQLRRRRTDVHRAEPHRPGARRHGHDRGRRDDRAAVRRQDRGRDLQRQPARAVPHEPDPGARGDLPGGELDLRGGGHPDCGGPAVGRRVVAARYAGRVRRLDRRRQLGRHAAGDHRRVAGRAGAALAPGPAGLSDPDVQGHLRPRVQDDHHRVQRLRPAAVRGHRVPRRGGHAV